MSAFGLPLFHIRRTTVRLDGERRRTSVLLSLLFTLKGMAQGIIVQGAVRDAFDDTALEGAHVHILDGDSNVVARTAATVPYTTVRSGNTAHSYKDPTRGAVFECTVPKGGDYTVVASMVGEILTVQEAGGFQMNIAKWDDETLRLWNTPCHTPAYSKE